eukprot:CAMPEP_0181088052 /NCGR_PEP_ID=MMETSP1071-20121207/6586_1 /TAXON_ID=35127 /ORGANISM="Thalassiosira sp., Strain NH16" /LENGTH=829 /DNA_ID=CAMNT_0023169953 /DNA_START=79 /DNA_END=2564 /DNA_ORIENTATION=-
MAKRSLASTTIRRPPSMEEDGPIITDADDSMLDEFYSDSRRSHNDRSEGRRSPLNCLVEELDDLHSLNASTSVRRRRVEDNDMLSHHHPRNYDGCNSTVDNDEFGDQDSHHYIGTLSQQNKPTLPKSQEHLTWNKLNATLFVGQALLSAATSAPITLVPTMALSLARTNDNEEWSYAPYYNLETLEVYDGSGKRKRWIPFRIRTSRSSNNGSNQQSNISSSSVFASHLTSVVTLVTAFGKFLNGVLVDVAGARRLLLLYGMCTCLALVGLRYSTTPNWAIGCCAAVEFFSSINWPAGIVILGAHYGMDENESNGRFERGLYVMSLASRCGSLLSIPLSSLLIKWTDITWRGVAGLAAFAALGGVVVFWVYLMDSPRKVHDPQNPIRTVSQPSSNNETDHHPYHPSFHSWSNSRSSPPRKAIDFCSSVFHTVLPSLRAVLVSRVFWAVAAAHAGATMVKSSERIVGTYFRDTSFGMVTESKAGAMTVFLSSGMLGGLLVGGKAFARAADSEQGRQMHSNNSEMDRQGQSLLTDAAQLGTKNMIAFFYCFSICMCYMLSFFAMPFVRRALHLPVLVLILQVLATLGLGFGVAVQYYHIPAIVGATFGKHRGLYTAYTDGVAALVSSILWRVVGGAVEEGNPQGGGWAYGWAVVALLLVFCGTLMVKIIELYFVGGGWRHDIQKDHVEHSFPMELAKDFSTSWMDDEIRSTGLSIDASPLRKHGNLNILSSSALDFIGSPGRIKTNGRKSLLANIDSHDEEDTTVSDKDIDILVSPPGIDDDGSLLFPHVGTHDFESFSSMVDPQKEVRENDSCIRESSVFDDPYDQYNRNA